MTRQFSYRYDTLRWLVSRLRSQCRDGTIPPFSLGRNVDGPRRRGPCRRRARKRQPSPTNGN